MLHSNSYAPSDRLVGRLQLPLNRAEEATASARLTELSKDLAKGGLDLDTELQLELESWSLGSAPGSIVQNCVQEALSASGNHRPVLSKDDYFEIHLALVNGTTKRPALAHDVAVRVLARARLVKHLLIAEEYSCSQVARLLRDAENLATVSAGAIEQLARKVATTPRITAPDHTTPVWDADFNRAQTLFVDGDLVEAYETCASDLSAWMPEQEVRLLLERLVVSGGDQFWPYLQLLHYCTFTVEFYDHPPSDLYEFSPRGQYGEWIFDHYPASTSNPILNNAKATASLNLEWARNRGGDNAHALVEILARLDALPYAGRRHAARTIRAFLHRVLELETVHPKLLKFSNQKDEIERVANSVASQETGTQGVIEQRLVDFLGSLKFSGAGWKMRGVGDSVNASNLSKKKFGDIEFANVNLRQAVAIEAHGGRLTKPYVNAHHKSLRRLVEQRLHDSWAALDDAKEWSIRVDYWAHSMELNALPNQSSIAEVRVEYSYTPIQEVWDALREAALTPEGLLLYEQTVIRQLNHRSVRESARTAYRDISGTTR